MQKQTKLKKNREKKHRIIVGSLHYMPNTHVFEKRIGDKDYEVFCVKTKQRFRTREWRRQQINECPCCHEILA
jgi:hypothetical protein